MRANDGTRTGGEILIDQLVIHGVQHVFCVPGESYLAALDAFYDRPINLTVCRQEGGATMMAEAVGKVTGRPGVVFCTRGPGATNASPGIHIAKQDSTPLIVFVGQVGREMREREAFQELDYRAVFGSMTKWATEIDDPARIPEIVSRAFYTACNGRPGPVVVALPEDMLVERVAVPDAPAFEPVETWPGLADMAKLQKLLWAAKSPIVLAGGSRWSEAASASLARFADRFAVPVATTFRRTHLIDTLHASYAGDVGLGINPKLLARIKASDLVRADRRPARRNSLAGLFAARHSRAAADLRACASRRRGARPRLSSASGHSRGADRLCRGAGGPAAAERDFLARRRPRPRMTITWSGPRRRRRSPAASTSARSWCGCARTCRRTPFITTGAGNFSAWVHRFYRFRKFATHIGPCSGSMGYGVPSALGIKRAFPERTVVCFSGDGDFLMNGQEFATAVQYDLPIIVVIADNGTYGTIRMHQEREYPTRVVGTELRNPDFTAYAKAFGGFGVTVEKTADFAAAFKAAEKSGKPSIIHLKVDTNASTPGLTLEGIRAKSLAGQGR